MFVGNLFWRGFIRLKILPPIAIVTTESLGIMREIHNSKMRMPIAFHSDEKMNDWLGKEIVEPDWGFIGVEV